MTPGEDINSRTKPPQSIKLPTPGQQIIIFKVYTSSTRARISCGKAIGWQWYFIDGRDVGAFNWRWKFDKLIGASVNSFKIQQ